MFETHDIANADFDVVTFNGEMAGFFDAEIGFFRLDNPNVQLVQRPDAADAPDVGPYFDVVLIGPDSTGGDDGFGA